jgi:tetratricopeptide (TPR) repeat protein
VLLDAVTDEFREKHPVRYVDTYETGKPAEKAQPVAADSAIDADVKARLQALGYIGPDLNDDIVRQGRIQAHLEKGDLAGAKKEVEALLQKEPNDLAARLTMARLLDQEGKAKEAETYYRQIADEAKAEIKPEEKPMYAQALRAVALDDHLAGKTDQAIAELEHSLDLMPGNPEGEYNLGVMFEGRQDYLAAITHYEKAVGLDPSLALAHNNLGNCYQKVGEIQKAIAEYRKTAEVDPKHVECHYNLGVLDQLIGRTEDAAREFDAAIAINPDFTQASAALGELCLQRADYDHAIAVFQGLLQKEPANPAHLFLYGKALAMKGELDKARQSIGKAKALDPAGVADALQHDPALAKLIGPLPPERP